MKPGVAQLRRLHAAVIAGDQARAERDALMLRLHAEEGWTQTDLAFLLDRHRPGTMTRNQAQKILTRERERQ